jgi:hypothetical protein
VTAVRLHGAVCCSHLRVTGASVPAGAKEQGLLLLSNMARIDERFYGPLASADICGHVRSLLSSGCIGLMQAAVKTLSCAIQMPAELHASWCS